MSVSDRIEAWVDSTRPHNWYGQCAGLTMSICRHFGVLDGGPYGSAYAAYLASEIESTDPTKCPPGGIHFWDGYFHGSQGGYDRYGHVVVDINGGGTHVLSATSRASSFWGVNAGIISIAAQTALIRNNKGGRYLGWSRTYGRHRVTALTPTTAGGNSRPFEEEDMPLTNAEKQEIAELAAREVWGYKLQGRTAGERIRSIAADVWNFVIGAKGQEHLFHGRAQDGLALTTVRSGKGAARGAEAIGGIADAIQAIAELQSGQQPSQPTQAQLEQLAIGLKAILPAPEAAELAKRLSS